MVLPRFIVLRNTGARLTVLRKIMKIPLVRIILTNVISGHSQ